jgi:hypothetical protein
MRGLLAACFAVALCGIACAEEHSTTKGTGVYSCAKYAALFQIRPDEADATFFPWAMAYISDVNSKSAGAFFDLNAMSTGEMKRYLRVYCSAYPSADYSDAVEALMKSLPRVKR